MKKKALLIGINYPGTPVELRGCVNDVRRMERCLIDRFGFTKEGITVMVDTGGTDLPTGDNIRKALKELIKSGEEDSCLVFHYSGHGTRLPPEIGNVEDLTGFDECITPCDMNLIKDHEIRAIAENVKEGCRLTIITDSCHSGGLNEDVKEQIGESHVNLPKPGFASYLLSIIMTLFATCGISKRDTGGGRENFPREIELDDGEIVEVKTRNIPPDTLISLLEQQTGQTNIKPERIRQTLADLFGEDSSLKVLSNSVKRYGHRGFFDKIMGKHGANGGDEIRSRSLHFNNGILLSGCQTNERSEDVYLTRTGKAYGAFSNAIQTILSETSKEKKMTNRQMVWKAREILRRQNFSQRPGLYCDDRYVDEAFICE